MVLLWSALAVQVCLAAIVFVDPPVADRSELSQWGAFALHPEREAPLFLATVASALLVFLAVSLWVEGRPPGRVGKAYFTSTLVQGAVAIGATGVFTALLAGLRNTSVGEAHPFGRVLALVLTALVTLVFLAAAIWGSRGSDLSDETMEEEQPARLRVSAWDLVVPAGVFLLLWVPDGAIPAGKMFLEENNIHWDLFSMAQALMFRHGQALGTDTYSYYGAGWPMVFAGLARWIPLSYGRMIQIGSVYLALYMCGVYLFFRILLRGALRAAIGTTLVLAPCFYWLYELYFWRSPNVTPMRWAFDVWCLLALVMHARSGRRAWAAGAGALAGLGIVFNINGGLELLTAVLFYFLGALLLKRPGAVRDLALAGLAALVVAVAGLVIAGRGEAFDVQFWTGWLKEPLVFSSLPLLTGVRTPTLFWFAGLVFGYLAAAAWAITRAVRGSATMLEWLAGAVGVYGLMQLIKFVRYSSDQTFFRLLTPATILLMFYGARAWDLARLRWKEAGRWKLAGQVAAALVVALAVGTSGSRLADPILAYPNLLSQKTRGAEPEGLCLLSEPRDLCGLPAHLEQPAAQFKAITGRLLELKRQGRTFAVIDENGSLFNLATDTGPFFRYPRIFFSTIDKERVGSIATALHAKPPDYVLTRLPLVEGTPEYQPWSAFGIGPTENSFYGDLWDSLQEVVHSRYRLETTIEPYQLWRREAPAGTEP